MYFLESLVFFCIGYETEGCVQVLKDLIEDWNGKIHNYHQDFAFCGLILYLFLIY